MAGERIKWARRRAKINRVLLKLISSSSPPLKSWSSVMMQAKISSFFKSHCDPPPPSQISDQIDGKAETFGRNDHPKVLVTYKRRHPKPNESTSDIGSDDDVIQSDVNETEKVNGSKSNTSSGSDAFSKVLNKRTYSQFHLELGQSDFLLHTCSVCGLAYARGDKGDEKVHKAIHRDYTQGIQFKGWRNERVVFKCNSNGDRIVFVVDDDPLTQKYKVQQAIRIMEKELGFADGRLLHKLCQVYLFISHHRIVGCLIAEPIKTAHRVISSSNTYKDSDNNSKPRTNLASPTAKDTVKKVKRHCSASLQFGNIKFQREVSRKDNFANQLKTNQSDEGAILCEEETVPASCGIRAVWVVPCNRRKRVASKLLDAARKSFFTGHELGLSQCAFSSPTSAGKGFASSYSGSKSFLIYKTQGV